MKPASVTLRLAFFQPDIPSNLGAALRLSVCLGVPMDVIEPCAFPLTDKALKRAAMDYGDLADLTRWSGWSAFESAQGAGARRIVLMTTKGATAVQDFAFQPGDTILMGRESAGVPDDVHARADARIVIPMQAGARSLNVVNAASIACFEALRQLGATPGA